MYTAFRLLAAAPVSQIMEYNNQQDTHIGCPVYILCHIFKALWIVCGVHVQLITVCVVLVRCAVEQFQHGKLMQDLTQVVPGFDMTIDQMLVYIPQLTARKKKLDHMRSNLPKERITSFSSNFVEYNYSNYDIGQAEADYEKAADELARAQTALDTVNTTVEFEV